MFKLTKLAQMSRQSMMLINRPVSLARFSTATSSDGYHSLDDQVSYTPVNKINFITDTYTIFDSDAATERRFVPFELKELSFKYTLIAGGLWTTNYMYTLGFFMDLGASGAVLSCIW